MEALSLTFGQFYQILACCKSQFVFHEGFAPPVDSEVTGVTPHQGKERLADFCSFADTGVRARTPVWALSERIHFILWDLNEFFFGLRSARESSSLTVSEDSYCARNFREE